MFADELIFKRKAEMAHIFCGILIFNVVCVFNPTLRDVGDRLSLVEFWQTIPLELLIVIYILKRPSFVLLRQKDLIHNISLLGLKAGCRNNLAHDSNSEGIVLFLLLKLLHSLFGSSLYILSGVGDIRNWLKAKTHEILSQLKFSIIYRSVLKFKYSTYFLINFARLSILFKL